MNNTIYRRESNEIRKPNPAEQRKYTLDLAGILNSLKQEKREIQKGIKSYREDLTTIREEEQELYRRRNSAMTKPESARREQYLAQIENGVRELRQERRQVRVRIEQEEARLLQIKEQEQRVKRKIRAKRIAKGAQSIIGVLVGAEKAAKFIGKHKLKMAIFGTVLVSTINIFPLEGEVQQLPEGRTPQEISIMEDTKSIEARDSFLESLRFDGNEFQAGEEENIRDISTQRENTDIQEQNEVRSSKSEEELLSMFLETFEGGCRLDVHDIGDGVLTMGWGHTESHGGEYKVGDTITKEQAVEFYKEDRASAYKKVNNILEEYPNLQLESHQINALASFTYNTGRRRAASYARCIF